jgi:TM2 domain-containing membrane protein YozV
MATGNFCSFCGSSLHDGADDCPGCGLRLAPLPAGLNKANLLLLAGLLGGIGAHRFYLRQYGLGALYLLFCWTLLPSIAALVEFFIFLSRSEEELREQFPAVNDEKVVFAVIFPLVATLVLIGVLGFIAALILPQIANCR